MHPFGETVLIDEDDLESSDRLEIYKELLRIIEKDIDYLSLTRFGLTPWSLLTALAAVGLILFGIGKGLFEADATIVGRSYLFSYFTLQWLNLLVSSIGIDNPVKPNRVYFPRERLGHIPVVIFRLFWFVIGIIIASKVWDWNGFISIALIGSLLTVVVYLTMALHLLWNPIAGNNPRYEKAGPVFILLWHVGSAALVGSSFLFLPWPTELTASSFAIGGLLALLIFVSELYVIVVSPNPIVRLLLNLRDEIIFRRKSLNEALLELRRIREGSTYFEILATEIKLVSAKTSEKFQTLEAAKGLLDSIENLLETFDSDGTNVGTFLEEIALYERSYALAKSNVLRLKNDIDAALTQLNDKAIKVINASGDTDSPELFDSFFNETHDQLNVEIKELLNREAKVAEKIAIIRNSQAHV